MQNCKQCGLERGKRITQEFSPSQKYKYAVVGDNPNLSDTVANAHFSSTKGEIIKSIISQLGFDVKDFMFTNICSCATYNDRSPSVNELDCCKDRFMEELKICGVERIIVTGLTAIQFFDSNVSKVEDVRGIPFFHSKTSCWIIPTFDMSKLFTNPGLLIDVARDISKITMTLPFDDIDCTQSIITKNSDISDFENLYSYNELAIDIETNNLNRFAPGAKVLTMAIAVSPVHAYVFTEQALNNPKIVESLNNILRNPKCIRSGHNAVQFDEPFILQHNGVNINVNFDVMQAHFAIDERPGTHKLEKVAREFLCYRNWKEDIKEFIIDDGATYESIPKDILYEYCANDACTTFALRKVLHNELAAQGRLSLLDRLFDHTKALAVMEENGTMLDVKYLSDVGNKIEKEMEDIQKELVELTGIENFNPRSYIHVGDYVYKKLKLQPPKGYKRNTSKETINAIAESSDNPGLQKIAKYRSIGTMKSTFCDGLIDKVDIDGRIRTHFKVHGNVNGGRPSSADPCLMNVPKRVGNLITLGFVATPGWILCNSDYSQLEMRAATWYSGEETFINAFNNGLDLHTNTAAFMFHKKMEDVSSFERFCAKAINFGVLYGMGADKLALSLGISKPEAQNYLDEYFESKKNLAKWIQETKDFVDKYGYSETPNMRRRHFPLDTGRNTHEIHREAVNMTVQSFAGDICMDSAVRANKHFISTNNKNIRLLSTIYDSILYEVKEEYINNALPLIKQIMEDVPLDSPVKFKVDLEYGKRWGELIKEKD